MPTNLRIVHELITYYKNPDYVLQGGSHGFEGIHPLWPPLPGKAIKTILFYFTKNSVSMFRFGTGEHGPSFCNKLSLSVSSENSWWWLYYSICFTYNIWIIILQYITKCSVMFLLHRSLFSMMATTDTWLFLRLPSSFHPCM